MGLPDPVMYPREYGFLAHVLEVKRCAISYDPLVRKLFSTHFREKHC